MSLKCCLSAAYYIKILSYQDTLYFLYLSLCLSLILYMSYLCNLFAIIIFTSIAINHVTSLIQTNWFFGHVCQMLSLKVLLGFCLIFCKFQLRVAYKSVAYKKKRVKRKNKYPEKSCPNIRVLLSSLETINIHKVVNVDYERVVDFEKRIPENSHSVI